MLRLQSVFAVLLFTGGQALAAEPPASGAADFARHCQGCHNLDGGGRDAFYPALTEADLSRRELLETLLHGRFGRAGEQQGVTIPVMPSWWSLDDATVARIAGHVAALQGKDWTFAPGEVAALRTLSEIDTDNTEPEQSAESQAHAPGQLYAEHCAGCHGISREGAAGPALSPSLMAALGAEALQTLVHFGSSEGMPAWGMDERLSFDEIEALAAYLATPNVDNPTFKLSSMQASHRLSPQQDVTSPARPISELMVVLTHDPGQALVYHAPSRKLLAAIETADAPLQAELAADGRHLAVLSRGGQVSLIDLFLDTPATTARVRTSFQANAIAASSGGEGFLVGAYAPSQLVQLDADLKPLALWDTRELLPEGDSRIVDIAATDRGRFVVLTQGAGIVSVRKPLFGTRLRLKAHPMQRHLTIGRYIPEQEALIASSSLHEMLVWDDSRSGRVSLVSTPRFSNGNAGDVFNHPTLGEVWVAGSLTSDQLIGVQATSENQPGWVQALTVAGHGAGSLFTRASPVARQVWSDHAASSDPEYYRTLTVTDFASGAASIQRLPVAEWAGASSSARAVSPVFSTDGSEVWVAVWGRQDEISAVVVIDAEARSAKAVLRDAAIISPTRVFSLGELCRRRGDLTNCRR